MEPFRPIIDDMVMFGKLTEDNFKSMLNNILNIPVVIDGRNTYLDNSIKIYINSVFNALSNDDSLKIIFMEKYELQVYADTAVV
jgi:hypothetical protein